MQQTFDRFRDVADFLTVYIKEAHAQDEWPMGIEICYRQPKTLEERMKIARDFVNRFSYRIPMVVDSMQNLFEATFSAWPERLFIILNGKIEYYGKPGPFGYKPDEVISWLESHFPNH